MMSEKMKSSNSATIINLITAIIQLITALLLLIVAIRGG